MVPDHHHTLLPNPSRQDNNQNIMSSFTHTKKQATTPPSPLTTKARIAKLQDTLADISISISNRDILIELARHNADYHPNFPANRRWRITAYQHKHIYHAYANQIEHFGEQATEVQLERWERHVEDLRLWTLNRSEQIEELDLCETACYQEIPGVFTNRWDFEGSGIIGSALGDVPVDPLDAGKKNPYGDVGVEYSAKFEKIASTSPRW